MDVELDSGNRRKRKKSDGERKLLVGERVEVRSEEDGFLGSWHSGIVTVCGKRTRHVKYDHLLTEDEADSDKLVDIVPVSSVIDGTCCGTSNQCHSRGNIRPLRPRLQVKEWNLPYGLCVDAYYQEAWWEGVIFDHNDGFKERRIFFPDLGDEMTIAIESLRITQVWDEGQGTWHNRGTWLFLELIEEYEKESYIPVSVKQIWYDLRQKKGFKKVKEWTSPLRKLWKGLVREVIKENLKIFEDYLHRKLGLRYSLDQETQPLLELASSVSDVSLNPADLGKSHAMVPFEHAENFNGGNLNYTSTQPGEQKSDQVQLISVSQDLGPNMNLLTDGFCHDKSFCVLPQAFGVLPSYENSSISAINDSNDEAFSSIKSNKIDGEFKSLKCQGSGNWLPAGPDIVSGAEFCPTAITKYAQTAKKSETVSLVMDVKKHLKHLKWKIEFKRDDKGIFRHRYLSPDGKRYYSLRQVCLDLTETNREILSPISQDNQNILHATPDDSWSTPPPNPEDYQDLDYCPETVANSCTEILVVEPKHNPQAVKDWYMFGSNEDHQGNLKRKKMILNARRHLTFLGWEFKYVMTGKRILYYYAPGGKCYNSLRMACKACLDGGVGSESSASTLKTSDNIIASEVAKDQLASEKSVSLVPSTALSKDLSVEFSPMYNSRKRMRKRKSDSSHLLQIQADSCSANFKKYRRGKTFRASIKSGDDMEEGCRTRVLRSSKRVKTRTSSNHNPRNLLSWLIDNNVILPREKVIYCTRKRRRPKAEGRISREGIRCDCCKKVYSLSSFEVHASGTYSSPASHIFLEDGRSLLDCQLQALNSGNIKIFTREQHHKINGSHHQGENDFICSVCHYGGELMLCDRCPSAFHKHCLGLEDVPDGDWFCPSCCCGICGSSNFRGDFEDVIDENIIICYQCERKYHSRCLQNGVATKAGTHSKGNWFCSKKCENIFLGLCKLLGKPIPIGNDLTWTLVKSTKFDSHELDASNIEALSKLNVALCVMHECFEPVNEPYTRSDLVEDVIFSRWSELNRLNFQGFYTVLLEKNEELVTVATVRVYGAKAAEVPLVGTRFQHRRLGMCRYLMNELEKLMELGVQRLILPAIPSVLNTWTTSFGFTRMTNSERLQFVDYTFLDFQDTVMCQKLLLKSSSTELKLSRGLQPEIQDDTCESGDNIDLAGSSPVSEVFQTEKIEDNGIVEQRLLDVAVEHGISGSKNPNDLVVMLNQQKYVECESLQIHISPECSVIDANFKQESWNRDNDISYYKRRMETK